MNKSVLYIAFHFPPISYSSGYHRTLAFVKFLSHKKWDIQVLTASVNAYPQWDKKHYELIPEGVCITRSFSLMTSRHLSLFGRYFGVLALPDNWQSWIISGVISGLKVIRKQRPEFIISTYPIASAQIIAFLLHKVTKIPWISDFRDPMMLDDHPNGKLKRTVFNWIEKKTVKHSTKVMVTTTGAKALYKIRYPHKEDSFWQVIPNGYDDEVFREIDSPAAKEVTNKVRMLHSGVIYPSERDPTYLFQAIAELKKENQISPNNLEIILRATGHDVEYESVLEQLNIADIVKISPSACYSEAIAEMLEVDILILLQADNCNLQIPAKAYEYIRARKPILALTDLNGNTADLLNKHNISVITPLTDTVKIKLALIKVIDEYNSNAFKMLTLEECKQYSRKKQGVLIEKMLTDCCFDDKLSLGN